MEITRMMFLACPPVYTLPGTWNDPEKIAKCNDTLIPHFPFNPNYTFGISIAVITVLLAESHLSIHTWPEKGIAMCDIFTCGDGCQPELAVEYLSKWLSSTNIKSECYERI